MKKIFLKNITDNIFITLWRFKMNLFHLRIKIQLHKPPIIIGGCGRSGTTLLLSILSAHPEIFVISHETKFFSPKGYNAKVKTNVTYDQEKFYNTYFYNLSFKYNRWCEKTPKNVLFFKPILNYFKNKVKLIHIVRDGRDVVLSRHPKNPDDFWVSKKRWIEDVKAGLSFAGHPSVYTVRYEDLIMNFENTMKDLCKFLNISFHPNLKNFQQYSKARFFDSIEGEIQPISAKSIGKWREEKHNEIVVELLKDPEAIALLKELKYLEQ